MWTLVDEPSELPVLDSTVEIIHPGDYYPGGYRGTRFSVKSKSFQIKSYSDGPSTSRIPRNLVDAMEKYARKRTGSIRIRANGDTITKVEGDDVYLGKMRYGTDKEIFNGLQLFPDHREKPMLWTGPQSSNDVGEKWVVPAPNNNRPYLGRGRREQRVWSIRKRFDVTDPVLDYKEQGGRVYITFNGYMVAPIPLGRISSINVLGTLRELNEKEATQISARWIKDRLKRVAGGYRAQPYPMVVLGIVEETVNQNLTNLEYVRDDDELNEN